MVWFLIVKLDVKNGLQIFTWKKNIIHGHETTTTKLEFPNAQKQIKKKSRFNFKHMHPKKKKF